jgi:hypothetical protein
MCILVGYSCCLEIGEHVNFMYLKDQIDTEQISHNTEWFVMCGRERGIRRSVSHAKACAVSVGVLLLRY